jgi:hypothetical protein
MLAMVAVASYAARVLPPGARVPLNVGAPEHSLWLPKVAGLAAWLGAGVVTFAVVAAVTLGHLSAGWATSLRVVLLPCAMLIVLCAQAGAVIYARGHAGGPLPATGNAGDPQGSPAPSGQPAA